MRDLGVGLVVSLLSLLHTHTQSLVSGGVDSAVCTALLNMALGPSNVVALHIDNGFMRKEESKHVRASLEAMGLNPHGE